MFVSGEMVYWMALAALQWIKNDSFYSIKLIKHYSLKLVYAMQSSRYLNVNNKL